MRVEFIGGIEQCDPNNSNADVLLHLDDGRVFKFLVATPNNIYWCMENEQNDHYFGVPPVFVKQMTVENVERAMRALIESGEEMLKTFGSSQAKDGDMPVILSLKKDEALILFDVLADFQDQTQISIRGEAERVALHRLTCLLEKALIEPFRADYTDILAGARQRLVKPE